MYTKAREVPKGFPQGANTSPALSVIALSDFGTPEIKAKRVMYADDGIWYSNDEISEDDIRMKMEEMKVELNEEKTG